MNWFKRLCLFVFGISGILSLVALSLVWVGPWTPQARTLITENTYYFWALEILVCVSAAGLLLCVLMALFAPRNPKETIVATLDGGEITVTRSAIVSQTRHVIEADGACAPASIHVRVRKRGHVKVCAKVRPHLPIDIVQHGEVLHNELEQGLAKVCGDGVQQISLVFMDPEQQGTLSMYVDTEEDAEEQAPKAAASVDQEITVSMSSPAPVPVSEPEVALAPEPEPEPVPEPVPEPLQDTAELESFDTVESEPTPELDSEEEV